MAFDQDEVDRLVAEMGPAGRGSLTSAVATMGDLAARRNEFGLAGVVPEVPLTVRPAEVRSPRVYWDRLPAAFRASAEAVIDRAARPTEVSEDDLLARLDAGEDAEALMAEADAIAQAASLGSRNVAEFVVNAKGVLAWLVRAREAHCGQGRGTLTSPSDLLGDAVLRPAIDDHLAAAAAGQVKRVGHASTLSGRLTLLGRLAARGLEDPKLAARIALLAKVKVAVQAERDRQAGDEIMVADEIAARMRAAPGMGVAYVNAPARLSTIAEARIEAARKGGSTTRLLGAYKLHRGAAMAAILMSRPVRGHHLHEALIRPTGHLAGNLERLPGGALRLSWRSTGSKNSHAYAVTLRGDDADILREWLDVHRAAHMKAAGIKASPW